MFQCSMLINGTSSSLGVCVLLNYDLACNEQKKTIKLLMTVICMTISCHKMSLS